jgi:hypothetical protein
MLNKHPYSFKSRAIVFFDEKYAILTDEHVIMA